MSQKILEFLQKAATTGGGSVLSTTTDMRPADPSGLVNPSTVKGGEYLYQYRLNRDGEGAPHVLMDSKASFINRAEKALVEAIRDGHPVFGKINHVEVEFAGGQKLTEMELPGKIADTVLKLGLTPLGTRLDTDPEYIKATTENPELYAALAAISPTSLITGYWESRRIGGAKVASLLRGETYAELADRHRNMQTGQFQPFKNRVGGVRKDTYAVKYDPSVIEHVRGTLNDLTENTMSTTEGKKHGPAVVGLGNVLITDGSGGVAARSITRSSQISLSLLRRIRIGSTPAEHVAARTALLALGVAMDVLGAQDTDYRAGCALSPANPVFAIDGVEFPALSVDDAADVLDRAIAAAKGVIDWNGTVIKLTGDPALAKQVVAAGDE